MVLKDLLEWEKERKTKVVKEGVDAVIKSKEIRKAIGEEKANVAKNTEIGALENKEIKPTVFSQ